MALMHISRHQSPLEASRLDAMSRASASSVYVHACRYTRDSGDDFPRRKWTLCTEQRRCQLREIGSGLSSIGHGSGSNDGAD